MVELSGNACGGRIVEAVVEVHFKDMDIEDSVRNAVEKRCEVLSEEFPELTHLEVTVSPDGDGHIATGHATGKSTEVASHAAGGEPGHAADQLLDRLRQQLRRIHDKRIFARRRAAQRDHPRRSGE